MNLGEAIKDLRQRRGMKQRDLAIKTELTAPYLSQVEHGQKTPSLDAVDTIARALEVPSPVLWFMAMERGDVSESKRALYDQLAPAMKAMIVSLFDPKAK
ncbi:MAG TPA: helix-turn-helix transcriptional regulator [Flavobacteriales bacterium]|nr:helix-turn-helix transcriptional regulator [Flavobacteriales bacterium]